LKKGVKNRCFQHPKTTPFWARFRPSKPLPKPSRWFKRHPGEPLTRALRDPRKSAPTDFCHIKLDSIRERGLIEGCGAFRQKKNTARRRCLGHLRGLPFRAGCGSRGSPPPRPLTKASKSLRRTSLRPFRRKVLIGKRSELIQLRPVLGQIPSIRDVASTPTKRASSIWFLLKKWAEMPEPTGRCAKEKYSSCSVEGRGQNGDIDTRSPRDIWGKTGTKRRQSS